MAATSASLESASALPSHTIEGSASLGSFKSRKRTYALTLEGVAYRRWQQVHSYMTSRMKPNYALVCEHDGPDYPHIHCFYQYANNKLVCSDYMLGAHIETHVWSPQKYVAYCKAEDDKHQALKVHATVLIEEGELKKAGGFRTIAELKTMSVDERDTLPIQYKHIVDELNEKERREQSFFHMLEEIKRSELHEPDVYYITGMPGAGKTYGAYKHAMETYEISEIGRIKFSNQFAVIDNEKAKCFVIEEFRASDLRASELLQLMDKYGTNLNVKGGFVYCRPERLYICSLFRPHELYRGDELAEQFIRRLKKIYRAVEHELIED